MDKQEAYNQIIHMVNNECFKSLNYAQYSRLIDLLHEIKPSEQDPETGLMPCGCGGSAVVVHNVDDDGLTDKFYIMCSECKIETNWGYVYKTVECLWQRAMGWEGKKETYEMNQKKKDPCNMCERLKKHPIYEMAVHDGGFSFYDFDANYCPSCGDKIERNDREGEDEKG